jgi:hypothetical protein
MGCLPLLASTWQKRDSYVISAGDFTRARTGQDIGALARAYCSGWASGRL